MSDRSDNAGEALWRFSLALYARPGLAEALIALQDRAGCEVNLILFALWAGAVHRCALDAASLAAASATLAPAGGGIIASLRRLRRELREAPGDDLQALRRRVLRLELAAERAAQHRLATCRRLLAPALATADPTTLAQTNLALYLGAARNSSEAAVLISGVRALTRQG